MSSGEAGSAPAAGRSTTAKAPRPSDGRAGSSCPAAVATPRAAPGPAPKQSTHRGRFHVAQQGAAYETQAALMTDPEVVNWLTDPEDNES